MVIETQYLPLLYWLGRGVLIWLGVSGVMAAAGLLFSFLTSAIRNGPGQAMLNIGEGLRDGLIDLVRTSPRRVMALSWLSFKESIRRRVLVAFGVFVVILLFASWFLDPAGDHPAQWFVTFVLTLTSYLMLALALILSTFSLPTDIRDRTIFTIVSKPVRRNEIVLGRILGFVGTCTLLMAGMGIVSYIFVLRGLSHNHLVDAASLATVDPTPSNPIVKRGDTDRSHGHRHRLRVYQDGTAGTDREQGHWHEIEAQAISGQKQYLVGPPQEVLNARQPRYGVLSFRDRAGQPVARGVNVGSEWEYRSYIEGGTKAAAVWHFKDVTEADFKDGLPVELTLRVFRTYKGDINQGILGSIQLINPSNGRKSRVENFIPREYDTDVRLIPRELVDKEGKPIELFRDLVFQGELDIEVTCVSPAQYFGMAQYDVYLRAADRPFWLNFMKGYFGIWLQMVLVTSIGVMFSTFVRGSVAMLGTIGAVLGGFFTQYMYDLSTGKQVGGGPLESMIRILSHKGEMIDLDAGFYLTVTKMIDALFSWLLLVLVAVLPDLGALNKSEYVAQGFDIPVWTSPGIVSHGLTALAYLLPIFLVAHFSLRSREVAQ